MVWKPFVLGDCVPCTCRVTVEKSFVFLLFDNSQFRKLGEGNGVSSICFAYQGYILRHILQTTIFRWRMFVIHRLVNSH
jgi:hypothetical protein